jgi:hypothetical protein
MSKILTNPSGNIKLELRDDRLSAWLTIQDQHNLSNEQDILDLIDLAGIKNGFEEALQYMRMHNLEKDNNTPFPIAMCNRVQGESKLHYFFQTESARDFNGVIHPADLSSLTCIEAGSVLAEYRSNIFERHGSIYDIYGEMIRDDDYDADGIKSIAGDNVSFDPERQQFLADTDGYPCLDEHDRISIIINLSIEEDIKDVKAGIHSPVPLEIFGSVENTPLAIAAHLKISGDLINSEVYCEGNLQVNGAIFNCSNPGLKVLGDIVCAGIKSSKVMCRGRITFEDILSDCHIVADGGIFSTEGSISKGHYESGNDIVINNLGDPEGGSTELEITISPFNKALLMQLTKEIIHLKQDPEINAEAIQKLNNHIKLCESSLDNDLNDYLQQTQLHKMKLHVHNDVFAPVHIRILKHEYIINSRQIRLEIVEKD